MTRSAPIWNILRELLNGHVDELVQRVERAWTAVLDEQPADPVVLGRYQLAQVLGSGTYGVVFSAFDRVLERDVAVKVLQDGVGFENVLDEARLLARARHPHVVAVLDATRIDDYDLLVMELVDGDDMRRARSRLTPHAIIEGYLQVGRGLAAAHGLGIVHGDVKPSNILVDHLGRAYLADFGQARLAERELEGQPQARGTDSYLAPESCNGAPIDQHGDQFALCLSLWESLYRRRPWRTKSGEVMGPRVPPRLDVAELDQVALVAALRRGLATRSSDRFPSVEDLVLALEPIVEQPSRKAS